MLVLYGSAAYQEDGWEGIATLIALGLGTYAGFFFRLTSEKRMVELGVRWLVNTVTLFFGVGIPVGLWVTVVQGRPPPQLTELPVVGIAYFALLSGFELFRLYDRFGDSRRPSRTERRNLCLPAPKMHKKERSVACDGSPYSSQSA